MGHALSAAIRPPFIGGFCRGVLSDKSHHSRYAPAFVVPYWSATQHGPCATDRIVHPSTSSIMFHFSMSFFSVGHFFWMKTRLNMSFYQGGNGSANAGGTSSRTFAEDGDTWYSDQHPTWDFASFAHMARRWQTCWHIHHLFHSSSITLT